MREPDAPASRAAAAAVASEAHPLILGDHDDTSLSNSLFRYNWSPTGRGWLMLWLATLAGTGMLVVALGWTLVKGIGVWGNNVPVAWAFGITNFVWWIGIGHAGTLISAILLLLQQQWRTSINRFAEAMTLFAVVCAGMFPIIHTGRPWFAYWLVPYPSVNRIWPNFKSPLVWDVFAVSTYLTISFLFWYMGLVPDLAALRDASHSRLKRRLYGIFALGWRGGARQWRSYQSSYLLLAGISTPLVVSVHTIVSFDFAVAIVPGWYTTIFPPYFVAGAIFSGFAMVMTLIIPARRFLGLEHVITLRHLENMCKLMLVTGMVVGYGYLMENFIAWYSGDPYEMAVFADRRSGAYAPVWWLLILCNILTPQIFWWPRARTSLVAMWVASILINVGMWCERFLIVVQSLHHDYLPGSWRMYYPTWVDITLLVGTISFFLCAFLLFLRFLPAVSATEVKELRHELQHEAALRPATGGIEMERVWLLGEFTGPGAMVAAAQRLAGSGLAAVTETHSPYPVEAAYEVLDLPRSPMPRIVAIGALVGVTIAYAVQWWCNAVDYPINVGGRPDHALPSFIPITFEVGVLCAGLAAFFGLWGHLGMPRPYHPVFELERFRTASVDRYWVSVVTTPGAAEEATIRRLLDEAGAIHVAAVHERESP